MSRPDQGVAATADVRPRVALLASLGYGLLESGQLSDQTELDLRRYGHRLGLNGLAISSFGRMLIIEAATEDGGTVSSSGAARSLDAIDCTRLRELDRLAERTASAPVARIAGVDSRRHLLAARRVAQRLRDAVTPWWVGPLGLTMLAFFICMQVGVSWQAWVCAAVVQIVSSAMGVAAGAIRVPRAFAIAVQSAVAGAVATLLVQSGFVDPVGAAAAIAVNWLLLLPLPQVIGSVIEAISGNHLSAISRVANVAVAGVGIFVGGALTFELGEILGMAHPKLDALPSMPWFLILVFSALGAVANAFANGGRLDLVLPAAALGATTAAVNQVLLGWLGLPALWSSSLAAVVLGLLSARLALRTGYPSQVLALMGITGALLPGIPVFFGILQEMGGAAGTSHFGSAVAISVGIGAGVALGGFLSGLIRPREAG